MIPGAMKESGVLDRMLAAAMDKTSPCGSGVGGGSDSYTEIGYENIFTAFVVLGAGVVIAVVIAAVESAKKRITLSRDGYS